MNGCALGRPGAAVHKSFDPIFGDRPVSRAAAAAIALFAALGATAAAEDTTVARLAQETHFHGLAVDAANPMRLFLATHNGFYAVAQDGTAVRQSDDMDFMGFAPHPADATILYASGHPAKGGNLGVMTSTDGGKTWKSLSRGLDGPVDFHQMTVSRADPLTLYGIFNGVQVSHDGGKSWARVTRRQPAALIALAASSKSASVLYAATELGILISRDGGEVWDPVHPERRAVTAITVTAQGDIYAYMLGVGLIRASESDLKWQVVSPQGGKDYMLHFAVSPAEPNRFYAVMNDRMISTSADGGKSWRILGAN